ncbi:MAG: cytochrome c biogenesis protein CcdA [Tissierellia bacterium]|nr:cytochrome c biogenesis protein CcdA [Tissierellia bacterium]
MTDFWTSLTGGFLTFFTPCVLPMVPIYLMYLTGSGNLESLTENKKKTFIRALAFVLGFTLIFVLMGMGASAIGKTLLRYKDTIQKVGAVIIIIFGIMMLGVIKLPGGGQHTMRDAGSFWQAMLMGMAFSVGWSPCFGPLLGAILALSSQQETLAKGALLLLVYSLGMGIPFLISSLFVPAIQKFMSKHEKGLKLVPKIAGVVMILFGLLMLFNKLSWIGLN